MCCYLNGAECFLSSYYRVFCIYFCLKPYMLLSYMLLTARSAILAKKLPPVYCFLSKTLCVAFLSNGAECFFSRCCYLFFFLKPQMLLLFFLCARELLRRSLWYGRYRSPGPRLPRLPITSLPFFFFFFSSYALFV